MLNRTTYLLVCLIEECAEVIQRTCKAIRFGLKEVQQTDTTQPPNDVRLHGELRDLQTVLWLLQKDGILQPTPVSPDKEQRLKRYLSYSIQLGLAEKEAETAGCGCGPGSHCPKCDPKAFDALGNPLPREWECGPRDVRPPASSL